jgi:hypothetical protein
MKRRHVSLVLLLVVTTALYGCAVNDGGYGYGPGYGAAYAGGSWDGDFYEPYGFDYGYWGPGYLVAPYQHERVIRRDVGHRSEPIRQHAFRPAPAAHRTPSLPATPRAGGAVRGPGRH